MSVNCYAANPSSVSYILNYIYIKFKYNINNKKEKENLLWEILPFL